MGEKLDQSWRARKFRGRGMRHAETFLQTGAWRGEQVWLLGGGPSLPVLTAHLPGKVIAINMAFIYPNDLWFVGGRALLERLRKTTSLKKCYTIASASWSMLRGHQPISFNVTKEEWGRTVEGGLPLRCSSGCMAINIADILGASRIFLLGFDMRGASDGFTANWHKEYPDSMRPPASHYQSYCENIERRTAHCNAEILNLTPNSALDCFTRADLSDYL